MGLNLFVRTNRKLVRVVVVIMALVPLGIVDVADASEECSDIDNEALAEICRDASPDTIIGPSQTDEGTTTEVEKDVIEVSVVPAESSGVSVASTQSCTYDETLYAAGGGNGDHLYGYTTNLGSKAAAHARSTAAVWQNRIAYVHMTVGHRLKWNGDPSTVNGRVVMPWHEGGAIDTSAQSSLWTTTSASGTMQIETGLLDETTGQEQTSIERTHLSSGTAYKTYSESGTRTYAVTYKKGHIYRPWIKLDGSAQAQGSVFNPALVANSQVDWMGGSNGAYLSYVRYEFDLPSGYTLVCS